MIVLISSNFPSKNQRGSVLSPSPAFKRGSTLGGGAFGHTNTLGMPKNLVRGSIMGNYKPKMSIFDSNAWCSSDPFATPSAGQENANFTLTSSMRLNKASDNNLKRQGTLQPVSTRQNHIPFSSARTGPLSFGRQDSSSNKMEGRMAKIRRS